LDDKGKKTEGYQGRNTTVVGTWLYKTDLDVPGSPKCLKKWKTQKGGSDLKIKGGEGMTMVTSGKRTGVSGGRVPEGVGAGNRSGKERWSGGNLQDRKCEAKK